MLKSSLRRKGECIRNLEDMDSQKERALLQEYDSPFRKKKQCLEIACTGVLTEVQGAGDHQTLATRARGGKTWTVVGVGAAAFSVVCFAATYFKSGNFCNK